MPIKRMFPLRSLFGFRLPKDFAIIFKTCLKQLQLRCAPSFLVRKRDFWHAILLTFSFKVHEILRALDKEIIQDEAFRTTLVARYDALDHSGNRSDSGYVSLEEVIKQKGAAGLIQNWSILQNYIQGKKEEQKAKVALHLCATYLKEQIEKMQENIGLYLL